MDKIRFLLCIVVVIAGIVLPALAADVSVSDLYVPSFGSLDPAAVSSVPDAVKENVRVRLSALPLTFIPNRGQYDPAVVFVVTGPQSTLFFTQDEIVVTAEEKDSNGTVSHVVRQTFPGASAHPGITGTDQLPGTANFFSGSDPSQWQTGVPTYGAVEYHDLYPGIDLRYRGTEGTLKREFIVAPGADPSVILLQYDGVGSVAVDETGALVLTAGNSTMTESPLICYQEIDGKTVPVSAAYQILDDHEVAFAIGVYDPAFPLVIDPALVYLGYSTYLCGTSADEGWGIAVDSSGNAYVTGSTGSTDFPTTDGANDLNIGGTTDAFVTKLNAAGSGLVYSTYLGGAGGDLGYGIAVDSSGNAYVTGSTGSTDFPTTGGAYNRTKGGSYDVFVTKLNAAGSILVYSTYLGGSDGDSSTDIAVDSSGSTYVTGYTYSSDFPTTAVAFDVDIGGITDAFVTKLNAAGSDLVYSTYLGGTSPDYGYSIAVDSSRNAYVTGSTGSTDFPTTGGAYDRHFDGSTDAFVTKLNPAGSGLVYSTCLGGTGEDHGKGIAVDSSGNAYVTGYTYSSDFPTTGGAYDLNIGGITDAFVTKLNPAGSGLVYSTYLGGTGEDQGYGIAVDSSGNAYVTGTTGSTDFPTTAFAYDRNYHGYIDVFVTKVNPARSGLIYSTYLGGTSPDYGYSIAVDSNGYAYVTGKTVSTNFPETLGAYDRTFCGGSRDAFIAKFSLAGSGIGLFRPSTGKWYFDTNLNGVSEKSFTWGTSGDIPITDDFYSDGIMDLFIFRPSTGKWYFDIDLDGLSEKSFTWGTSGDIPLTGKFGGLGLPDIALFRPSTGKWYFKYAVAISPGGTSRSFTWGTNGDIPLAGDFNGDMETDIALFRPSTGKWYFDYHYADGISDNSFTWGASGDIPLTGDFNGDMETDIALFRPSTGKWYFDTDLDGASEKSFAWGASGDIPLTGDFNGDGTTEIALFRPSTGKWYFDFNLDGLSDKSFTWGASGDKPLVGKWV